MEAHSRVRTILRWSGMAKKVCIHSGLSLESMNQAKMRNARKKVNCKLVPKEHQVVGVGSYAADSVTATTTVVVPHLTNAEELQVGQELVVEAWKKPEKEKQKKRTWKSQELCAGKKKMKVI